MQSLLWAGMFLLVTIVGLPLGCIAFIGLPISEIVQVGVIAVAILVAASGIAIFVASPSATPSHPVVRTAAW